MAVERELRRLLAYARLPSDGEDQRKSVGSASHDPSNQDDANATTPATRVAVATIYERLRRVCRQQTLPSASILTTINVPELLVLVAEAAVYQDDVDVARACVTWFLSEWTVKNQFYCRVQLVRAYCTSMDVAHVTGAFRLRHVLQAIHFVLLVLPVATDPKRRPQYDFLVYNASVTYWHIARQLMKASTFQFLLPSLIAIVDALKTAGEKDMQWILRLQLTIVHAQIDAKHFASAAKTVCDLVDTQLPLLLSDPTRANDAAVKALYEEALRLQVHVGAFKDPECQKILANIKKTTTNKRTSLITKLQALKSGAFAGTVDAALTELFQETTGMTAFIVSSTTDDEIIGHLRGLDAASAQSVDAEILVETGIIAAFRHEYRHAACCDVGLQAKGKAVEPKLRVLHQVLKAILVALLPPPTSANFKLGRHQRAALVVARRVEGVKAIERALLACKRQKDPTLLENVCLYAWNLSLPLLQPQSRDQLSRLYALASSSLEELQSLQLNLRVRLMLELAKFELNADFMSKAQDIVNNALGLDYGTITTPATATATASPTLDDLCDHESKWMQRPVDVHLLPLRKRLDVKLAVQDPVTNEEELTAAVEQLREAKTPDSRRRQLGRVLTIVDNTVKEQKQAADRPATLSVDLLLHLNTTSAFAWHEMRDAVVAAKLARQALHLFFSTADSDQHPPQENVSVFKDKSVLLLEVDLRLRLVELIGHDVKARTQRFNLAVAEHDAMKSGKKKSRDSSLASRKQGRKLNDDQAVDTAALLLLTQENLALGIAVPASDAVSTSEDSFYHAVVGRRAALEAELLALKMEVLHELGAALRASTRIGWGFVIENTAAYLWNYHFHIFCLLLTPAASTSVILPECIAAFEAALAALESLPAATTVNLDLLASVALGLALVQEKLGKLDKAVAIADGILKRHKASTTTLPALPTLPTPIVPSISLLLLKRFAALKVRIQIQQNVKEVTPVDITPPIKVASLLEAMDDMFQQHQQAITTAAPPAQIATLLEKALGFFHKALAAWQPIANESLDRIKCETVTLEEQQQLLEIYCEIWVRLGCGAFRVQNPKLAIDCGERAVVPINKILSESEQRVWVSQATWKWLAVAELVCGRSILTLLSGETAAWTLIEAALTHVVRSTQYAVRAGATSVLGNAAEVAWNAVVTAMAAVEVERATGELSDDKSEAHWWPRLLPLLRDVLKPLGTSESSRLLGEFGLLVLDVCEKANDWIAATDVAECLMRSASSSTISADHMKDITTVHAIAVASLGDGTSGSGGIANRGKGKDHDPLVQAKIMRKIAFSSWRNPPAQLKALVTAHKALHGKPEEQALVLVEMAEWFFTHNFPRQEVETHLDVAMSILLRGQQHSRDRGTVDREGDWLYPPLWYADKLIRLFTMQAATASSMPQRWDAVGYAMHQVYTAWQCIVDMANDAELRDQYKLDTQVADEAVEFDAWKVGKPTKFEPQLPRRVDEWLVFYQQHATSLSSRFFMPWIAGLKVEASSSGQQHSIPNPLLTGSTLERLLRVLQAFDAQELSLPVVCLTQVVYHAFSPHTSKAMEIWLELTTYNVLEKLNLPVLSVPLQSALELLQTSGDAILKELQQQRDDAGSGVGGPSRRRPLLQRSAVNVSEKVAQMVELLLEFGFVRQAKVLLAMLRNVAFRSSTESETKTRCDVLTMQVQLLEGDEQLAVRGIQELLQSSLSPLEFGTFIKLIKVLSEWMPDKQKTIETLLDAERLAASAILSASESNQLHQPLHANAVAKYLTSLASTPSKSASLIHSGNVDLDAICGLAQLKLRRACLLLDAESSDATVEHAQRVFQEAVELLDCIDATNQLARCKRTFAQSLIKTTTTTAEGKARGENATQQEPLLLEARSLLREALVLLEDVRGRAFEPATASAPVRFTIPLEIEIANLKLHLTALELNLEESGAIVTDLQMAWYAYEKASRHTIVDKWLDATAVRVPMDRPGSVSRAFALASAVSTMLATYPESLESRGLAVAYRLRCERLALYHNAIHDTREAVFRLVWTRFTSAHSPHETWICAASNTGTNARAGEGRGRVTPALPSTENELATCEDANLELQQQLTALATELESDLKAAIEERHVQTMRVCAYELVQVYGCSQPLACAKALLQYQSIVVRDRHMTPLVETCLVSTNVTKLHMKRCGQLLCQHTNAPQNSLPYQLSQLFLEQQSDIYKRMNVSVSVDTILATLPPSKRILSFQFSPNQCFLYVAMVSSTDKCVAMARMECTTATHEVLSTIRKRIRAWRNGMTKTLLSMEDMSPQDEQQDAYEFVATSDDAVSAVKADALEREFDAIVHATTEFFRPLFAHSALAMILETEVPGNSLVLIVDRDLALLPLEALPMFDKVDAITREFSIHLLYHRLVAVKTQPFRKDDVRVVVDPHGDDTGLFDQTLTSVVHQFTKNAGAAFPNWKDAVEHGCVPTTTDWQQAMLLRKNGGLVYVGPNRMLGSIVSLPTLAGMNIANSCYALVLLDRTENPNSARRQSKIDSEKQRWELELEDDSYACALLSSLCGVNSVVLNQWTTTFSANRRLANALLGGLAKGQSLARAIRKYPESVDPGTAVPTSQPPPRKGSTVGSVPTTTAIPPVTKQHWLKNRIRFNTVVFGLGHLTFKAGE